MNILSNRPIKLSLMLLGFFMIVGAGHASAQASTGLPVNDATRNTQKKQATHHGSERKKQSEETATLLKEEKEVADQMAEVYADGNIDAATYKSWTQRRKDILAMPNKDPEKWNLLSVLERDAERHLNKAAEKEEARNK